MKILVLGCNGMAGHMVSRYLRERGHDVLGFARTKSTLVDSVVGDAMDSGLVKELVGRNRFDSVINCVGLLNQFAEKNRADAAYLNGYFPHFLAQITEGTETQIIHISTDCVFSGKRGQYTEDDLRDGETFYDRSKALGELEDNKNLTLRQSIIGPDIKASGIGLLNWFLQQDECIKGFTRAIWTGQTTLQLAKTIETAIKERAHGLYNAVPDVPISKFDLLMLFNKHFRNNAVEIIPADYVVVDKSLKRTRFEYDFEIPDYEQMVIELSSWIYSHKTLYPHYKLG